MFSSAQAKILVTLFLVLALTTAGVVYISMQTIDRDIYKQKENEARNILRLVMLDVQNHYDNLVKYKLETIVARRQFLKYAADTAFQVHDQLSRDYHLGYISEPEAKQQFIGWLKSYRPGKDNDCFVFNTDLTGLYHISDDKVGKIWRGYKDLKGHDALTAIRDKVRISGEAYTVMMWDETGSGKQTNHLVYFRYFSSWDWILGTAVPIGDLEKEVDRKKKEIIRKLEQTFSQISVEQSGYLFLFRGDHLALIHPTHVGRSGSEEVNTRSQTRLLPELIQAARNPNTPLHYRWSPTPDGPEMDKVAFVNYFKPLDWYITYTIPKADLARPARILAAKQIKLLLGIFFLCGACLFLLAKKATRPLLLLTRLAESLTNADEDSTNQYETELGNLARSRKDEIGKLSRSLVYMMKTIRRQLGEKADANTRLENEIRERAAMEELLIQARNGLERQVLFRTNELITANEFLKQEIGEREQVETALKEKEELLGKILSCSQVGICMLKNRRFLWGNEKMSEIFGFREDTDYIGQDAHIAFPTKEDYSQCVELFFEDLKQGRPSSFETKLRRFDGSPFYGHLQIAAMDYQNPCLGIVLTAADITGRKQAEKELSRHQDHLEDLVAERTSALVTANERLNREIAHGKKVEDALRKSEEHFRSLLDSATDFVIYRLEADPTQTFGMRVLFVSPSIVDIVGVDEPTNIEAWFKNIHPDDTQRVIQTHERALKDGHFDEVVRMYHPHKKQWRWIQAISTGVKAQGNDYSHANGIMFDVTKQKEAEKDLLIYQEKLRSMGYELSRIEEKERRRIAMDLHDQIGQCLAFSKLKLKSIQCSSATPQQAQALDELVEVVEIMARDIRTLTMELSPPILYDLGLAPALEWLTEEFGYKYGLEATYKGFDEIYMEDLDIRVILFRAVRELLTNVVKHARAKHLSVSTESKNGQLFIGVRDDGRGFDVDKMLLESKESQAYGLFSIRERLNSIGGRLEIESGRNWGTYAIVVAPLPSNRPSPPLGIEYKT